MSCIYGGNTWTKILASINMFKYIFVFNNNVTQLINPHIPLFRPFLLWPTVGVATLSVQPWMRCIIFTKPLPLPHRVMGLGWWLVGTQRGYPCYLLRSRSRELLDGLGFEYLIVARKERKQGWIHSTKSMTQSPFNWVGFTGDRWSSLNGAWQSEAGQGLQDPV